MKIPWTQLEQALEDDDNSGFCLHCGEQAFGVEPDARKYTCESCDQPYVYGAQEILLMGKFYYDDESKDNDKSKS